MNFKLNRTTALADFAIPRLSKKYNDKTLGNCVKTNRPIDKKGIKHGRIN